MGGGLGDVHRSSGGSVRTRGCGGRRDSVEGRARPLQVFAETSSDPDVEEAYRAKVWEDMAGGLSLRADDSEVAGRWVPVWTAMNGLAAETGFLYLLRFEPVAEHRWAGRAEVTVHNEAFAQHTMWRSAWVEPVGECRITNNSALKTLPFLSPDPMTSREVWRQDEVLKRLTVGWACDEPVSRKPTTPAGR